jgi:hypothetical protein
MADFFCYRDFFTEMQLFLAKSYLLHLSLKDVRLIEKYWS